MGIISTYTELKDEVEAWNKRSGDTTFTDRVPSFVKLIESDINRDARLLNQHARFRTTFASSATSRFLTLPDSFLRMFQVLAKKTSENDDKFYPLKFIKPELMWTKLRSEKTQPNFYTIRSNLEINSIPDVDYTIELYMLKKWDLVTDETNDLLSKHPDVYFAGAMYYSQRFVYGEEAGSTKEWRDMYEDAKFSADLLAHRSRDDEELDTRELAGLDQGGRFEFDIIRGGH